jgi:hypothetical protein
VHLPNRPAHRVPQFSMMYLTSIFMQITLFLMSISSSRAITSTLTTPSLSSFGNPEFSEVPGMSDAAPLAAPTATGRAVARLDKPL